MQFVLDDVVTVLSPEGVADPATDPKLPGATVVSLFKQMLFTRQLDERLVLLQRQGRIGFHIGSLGEEACILGPTAALGDNDWLWPCYREFGALLLRGMPLQRYMDNMYGNANDPVKGRQMPDHYSGRPYKFGSVSSPIGTQITQAVGFSWAAKMKGDPSVSLVFFGEGATSSNEFHNGMNFAGVYKTPTVFLCRNNGWAISVPAEQQTGTKTFAQKAFAYGVKPVRADGNDLLAMIRVTRDAVERARRGEGPTMIEAITHRLSGHSTSDDPKAYRKIFDFAREMGVETLVAEPPAEIFETLDGLCQEYKINLAVHNHPEGSGSKYWNPDTFMKACEGRSARIGACPDTGHWVRSGLDTLESLRKYHKRILTVHLKDAAESGKRDSRDVPLGTGKANYAAILKQLHDWKWRGVMTVEYEHQSPQLVAEVTQCVNFVEDFATNARK